MAGTVEKYGRGYRYRFELPRDPGTGKRRFMSKAGFASAREARRALATAVAQADEGRLVARNGTTVAEWLDQWLERAALDLKPTTIAGYRRAALKINASFGRSRLQDLTPLLVEQLYLKMLRAGLSPKTVRHTHSFLRHALQDAERLGLIVRNPAAVAKAPRVHRKEQQTWAPEQLSAFLNSTVAERYHAIFVVLATTGMRRGEVVGLRWSNLDLDRGVLSVIHTFTTVNGAMLESTVKTSKSRRQVSLDAVTVLVLRAHRAKQNAERLALGPAWVDHDLVFCEPDGSPLHPDKLTVRFRQLVRASTLPVIRLHDLRHTHATLALRAGVHPKVVSERLGHATTGITLDIYSHVAPELDHQAAEKVAGLLHLDLPDGRTGDVGG